jgi:Polyketide cyclase / dehydrase and lipid transport
MQFEASTVIHAPAAHIFSIYANVADWPRWDTDAKSASIDGDFVSGATGVVVPHGGPKSKIVFSRVVRDKSFTVECKLPLCLMRFDYDLDAQGDATRATHRVTFEGLLSPIFGRLIGSGMKKTLPNALAQLKALAEKTKP